MTTTRSGKNRVLALAIAVTLISGGTAGLGTSHDIPLAVIGSAVAILAGLYFLQIAARK